MATNFLLDSALTTLFEAAQNSSYEPLSQRARKVIQEEHVHFVHGEGWVRRLAKMGGAVRASIVASLARLWNETLCWFGPDDDPDMQRLYQEGILDASPDELRSRYLYKIMPTLNSLDIIVPVSFNTTTKSLGTHPRPSLVHLGRHHQKIDVIHYGHQFCTGRIHAAHRTGQIYRAHGHPVPIAGQPIPNSFRSSVSNC